MHIDCLCGSSYYETSFDLVNCGCFESQNVETVLNVFKNRRNKLLVTIQIQSGVIAIYINDDGYNRYNNKPTFFNVNLCSLSGLTINDFFELKLN